MVCGGKLICDARNTAILANLDVAGYGVLVSFVLSALLTVGAVICAYLSDSMPEKYLGKTDEAFIKEFQRIKKNLPFRLLPAKLRPPPTE
ncbi:hypothetical protein AA0112_g11824 [Alternaria arborescens]|nr:hypothetical protein AA0112_g11824 [Alternaria arborescens]